MRKALKLTAALTVILWLAAYVFAADLTWQQCVDEALVNNQGLISARAKLDQAKANSWLVYSGALPQISASGGGSKSGSEPVGGPYTSNESYSYSLRASQMIFDGLGTLQDMMASGENLKAAEMNYKISSALARYKLMQAYSGLMKAQELVAITGDILDLRKKQLSD
jgi:outer membrane protein TolC